jgi:hypothetical protein
MDTEITTHGMLAGAALAGKGMFDLVTIDSTKPETKFRRATVGEPGRRLIAKVWKVRTDRAFSAIDKRRVDAVRFRLLADKWKAETRFLSSTEDIVLHDAYQRIMAMGPTALPLIFAEWKREGDNPYYWHWALERLAGDDPTSSTQMSTTELRDAWLAWAEENGFTV